MQDHQKLRISQEAYQLTLKVYELCKRLPASEKFALHSQLCRAAVSVPTNVAEGCGRRTQADLAHFIQIAIASTNELDCLLMLTQDLNYANTTELRTAFNQLKKGLIAFLKCVRAQSSSPTSNLKPRTSYSI